MIKCQSCDREQAPGLLCSQCGAPLGAALDLFAALALPRTLSLDPARLEQSYHDLGRRIHPDRFAGNSVRLRDASLRATALLTRAYRTLRDPVSRGLYWLELNGHKLADNNQRVPTELAEMVFEVQDQLADLRAAGDRRTESAQRMRTDLDQRRAELGRMIEEARSELALNFARWDALAAPTDTNDTNDARSADREPLVADLKAVLSKIAYLRTLVRDIDRELDSAQAA